MKTTGSYSKFGTFMLWLLGVVLPGVTLFVELSERMCAEEFFDPLPTLWHTVLVALVPGSNLVLLMTLRPVGWPAGRWIGWLSGVALGVSIFYTLLFLPLLPLAAMAVVFAGLGLLPLAPVFSLIAIFFLQNRVHSLGEEGKQLRAPWIGAVASFLVLVALAIPNAITPYAMNMALSEQPARQARGLRWLRTIASQDEFLASCYEVRNERGFTQGLLGGPVPVDKARMLYFRATGIPFNQVRPTDEVARKLRRSRWDDTFDWDRSGEAVGGCIRGLSLRSSRFDGSVQPDGVVAYGEWTLVFSNTSPWDQEARMQVALPPGGVVSRLTLWVNDEEREAAFAGRAEVREAYDRIVRQKRDPVLVTTAGPDRVLVQCFPVPRDGGTMKIRVGITAPVDLDGPAAGVLRLPCFTEHNFLLPDSPEHHVWMESPAEIRPLSDTAGLVIEHPSAQVHAVRGSLPASTLSTPLALRVTRDGAVARVEVADPRGEPPGNVVQTLKEVPVAAPARLAVVVDGSRSMNAHLPAVISALKALPDGLEFGLWFAGDRVEDLTPFTAASETSRARAVAALEKAERVGGRDNAGAIAAAWDALASTPDSAILWLHGPQPVDLGGLDGLRQRWERRPDNPVLLAQQFGPGPDLVMASLATIPAARRIDRTGQPAADIARLLDLWTGRARQIALERERLPTPPAADAPTTSHIARLWAFDEVRRRAAAAGDEARRQAIELAVRYQLVTPVSGAVVLETQAQYDQAGLKPVDPHSVPIVPEPETWMLIGVCLVVLLTAVLRGRARGPAAGPAQG
jgi:hypothetical protein